MFVRHDRIQVDSDYTLEWDPQLLDPESESALRGLQHRPDVGRVRLRVVAEPLASTNPGENTDMVTDVGAEGGATDYSVAAQGEQQTQMQTQVQMQTQGGWRVSCSSRERVVVEYVFTLSELTPLEPRLLQRSWLINLPPGSRPGLGANGGAGKGQMVGSASAQRLAGGGWSSSAAASESETAAADEEKAADEKRALLRWLLGTGNIMQPLAAAGSLEEELQDDSPAVHGPFHPPGATLAAEQRRLGAESQLAGPEGRGRLATLTSALVGRRNRLVAELGRIYQRKQHRPGASSNSWAALDLGPAHDSYQRTSASLGYLAAVVDLAAAYLGVPLRYPIAPRVSVSYVSDPCPPSAADAHPRGLLPAAGLPLFWGEGARDRSRFAYALYLLSRDVVQVMEAHGLPPLAPNAPLQNLFLDVKLHKALPLARQKCRWRMSSCTSATSTPGASSQAAPPAVSDVFVLDFDGVVVDSEPEITASAFEAAAIRWPELFAPEALGAERRTALREAMRTVRPVLVKGYESMVMLRLLLRDPNCEVKLRSILSAWSAELPRALAEWGESEEELSKDGLSPTPK
eukprot:XP_001693556.1 predicted protein [Chlamydomonas reinhardtii]